MTIKDVIMRTVQLNPMCNMSMIVEEVQKIHPNETSLNIRSMIASLIYTYDLQINTDFTISLSKDV